MIRTEVYLKTPHLPSPSLAQHATSLSYDAICSFATVLLCFLKTMFNLVTQRRSCCKLLIKFLHKLKLTEEIMQHWEIQKEKSHHNLHSSYPHPPQPRYLAEKHYCCLSAECRILMSTVNRN